ncbi:uncharacterized protein [Argopecten irradians]|uniref:uncharacterized protein n=1 Tax=Argopecten irradians TaxID=31199 RepID=UPI003721737A
MSCIHIYGSTLGRNDRYFIQCYNYEYLKVEGDTLTGSHLGNSSSQLTEFVAGVRQFRINIEGRYEMCYTLAFNYEGQSYFLAIGRNNAVELLPAVGNRSIRNNSEQYKRCFLKLHLLGQERWKIESALVRGVFLSYNGDGKVEFRPGSGSDTQLFRMHRPRYQSFFNSLDQIKIDISFYDIDFGTEELEVSPNLFRDTNLL